MMGLQRSARSLSPEAVEASIQSRIAWLRDHMDALALSDQGGESEPLSDVDDYLCLDADLRALYKQLREARRQREKLKALYGPGDPMLESASWQLESALSAFETRLIELRADEAVQERLRILNGAEEEPEAVYEDEAFLRALERRRKREREEKEGAGWMYLWMWVIWNNNRRAFLGDGSYHGLFNARSLAA